MATTYIRTGEELRALSAQSNPVDLTFGRQFFESLIQWDFPQIYPINPWYHDSKSGNLYFRFLPWNWNEASVCYPHAAIAQILLDLLNSEQAPAIAKFCIC